MVITQKEMIDLTEIMRKLKFNIYLSEYEKNLLDRFNLKSINQIDYFIKSSYRNPKNNSEKPIKIVIRKYNQKDKFIFIRNKTDIIFLLKVLSRNNKKYSFLNRNTEIIINEE